MLLFMLGLLGIVWFGLSYSKFKEDREKNVTFEFECKIDGCGLTLEGSSREWLVDVLAWHAWYHDIEIQVPIKDGRVVLPPTTPT